MSANHNLSNQNKGGDVPLDLEKRRKILVVDDSPFIRLQMKQILKNYEVIEAEDGQKGFEAIENHSDLGLIFLDVVMPNINGLSLAQMIFDRAHEKKIAMPPIIILTTENTRDLIPVAKKAGVLGWTIKPPKAEQMLPLVEKILSDKKG